MKKVILCLCVFFLVVLFDGCITKARYRFMQETSEIKAIEIVEVDGTYSQEILQQATIVVVDDIDSFMSDFMAIDCYINRGEPEGIIGNATVIKIIYNNDEYELINVNSQSEYTHERQFTTYAGYRYFDKEQFENLIRKYLGE